MNSTRRIATTALVAAGLAANLGSNFVGPAGPFTPDSGLCNPGSAVLSAVGNLQTGAAGAPLPATLELQVSCTDSSSGGPVSLQGKSVTWAVRSVNGSVNGSGSASTVVDALGRAGVNWSLGSAIGTQTVTATVTLPGPAGSVESTSTFTATATGPRTGSSCAGDATVLQTNRNIAGSETWTLPGSPYRTGSVNVLPGATLRIDAGVTACPGSITVQPGGRLLAVGTLEQPVRLGVPDTARDTWTLTLLGQPTGAAAQPSRLQFVQASNLQSLAATDHALLVEDSRFTVNTALRSPTFCARTWLRSTAAAAADLVPTAIRRSSFEGYGGALAGCDASLQLEAQAALPTGPHQLQLRVQGGLGDGVAISPVLGAPAWALSQCELRGNGRDGLRITAPTGTAGLPSATISGCTVQDNVGLGINSLLSAGNVVLAQRNWWGDAAGPAGPRGDGVSPGVDASLPLAAPPELGY